MSGLRHGALAFFSVAATLACGCARDRGRAAELSAETAPAAQVAPATRPSDPRLATADLARTMGDASAPLWVVMVSDFQCPWCRMWHDSTFGILRREYVDTKKVRLAYLNLPLQMHPNALPAAEAAMCAGAQHKFWPMHDALFINQDRWASSRAPSAVFDSLARGVGVDSAAFQRCEREGVMRPLIAADRDRASHAGVRSTPSFFIGDSTRLEGAAPMESFRRAIDAALARAMAKAPARPARGT